ncbi:hypothetical protein [Sphingobium aromaticiconvertens]|uniref:hypothetical protein n=1 Tax=Sphingobium aromaticiconvertens TaxID=365341 RepID=UPI00301A5E77
MSAIVDLECSLKTQGLLSAVSVGNIQRPRLRSTFFLVFPALGKTATHAPSLPLAAQILFPRSRHSALFNFGNYAGFDAWICHGESGMSKADQGSYFRAVRHASANAWRRSRSAKRRAKASIAAEWPTTW